MNFIKQNLLILVFGILLAGMTGYVFILADTVKGLGPLDFVGAAGQPLAQAPPQPEVDLTSEDSLALLALRENDKIKGNRDAKLLLIEYSDYECPFCQQFHETAQQLVNDYDGQLAWAYRHFPLDIHPGADDKSIFAECIYNEYGEDAFWSFTDYIFENIQTPVSQLETVAADLGYSSAGLTSCLENNETADFVLEDFNNGLALGVNGTPGNFIYNRETGEVTPVTGALPYENIKPLVDQLL